MEVIVITGASAGVGRATAREFAKLGCKIALLARGHEGLMAAKRDVEELGGIAIAIECDVSNAHAVEQAAERVERELGPIDVWVNDAMSSVYGPFSKMSLADFHRITEVTYLGTVHGTKSALKRMLARDRGAIVQVSSALGFRSIPLQSAYCGAKHAIEGFSESLRTELFHTRSNVHITTVALPAVNTPQFEWTKTLLGKKGKPVGKIYQPEVPTRAIVWAAHHRRKRIVIGYPTLESLIGERLMSGLLDHYVADTAWNGSISDEPLPNNYRENLYEAVDSDRDFGAHGRFDKEATPYSIQLWLNLNRTWL
ncbi:MAG TPA: SDR family oxidoreductase, partial [Candidatus Kapabacteria bacterium]|nr:SDR family oxidoreductase [Candidatus Kapabacteria bacterium]